MLGAGHDARFRTSPAAGPGTEQGHDPLWNAGAHRRRRHDPSGGRRGGVRHDKARRESRFSRRVGPPSRRGFDLGRHAAGIQLAPAEGRGHVAARGRPGRRFRAGRLSRRWYQVQRPLPAAGAPRRDVCLALPGPRQEGRRDELERATDVQDRARRDGDAAPRAQRAPCTRAEDPPAALHPAGGPPPAPRARAGEARGTLRRARAPAARNAAAIRGGRYGGATGST
jgi:hypothetical protein